MCLRLTVTLCDLKAKPAFITRVHTNGTRSEEFHSCRSQTAAQRRLQLNTETRRAEELHHHSEEIKPPIIRSNFTGKTQIQSRV